MISRACCGRRARAASSSATGTVEVISDQERDGRHVHADLRQGVYVTFRAPTEYAAACFAQYGVTTDPSGEIAALWRPFHLIGLELGVSIASAALRGEPTGARRATAQRSWPPPSAISPRASCSMARAARRCGAA